MEIEPEGKSFSFSDYTLANTDTDRIDIATVTQTNSVEVGANLSPTFVGWLQGTGEANLSSAKYQRQVEEPVKQTYTKLNLDIKPYKLVVTREGERNIDISGNTTIKLTLRLPSVDEAPTGKFVYVVNKQKLTLDGSWLEPAKASMDISKLYLPPFCLNANVTLRYMLRHIEDGNKTYIEGDDDVKIYSGNLASKVLDIVSADEIIPPLWKVWIREQDTTTREYKNPNAITAQLSIQHDGAEGLELTMLDMVFLDYSLAKEFAQWMSYFRNKQPALLTVSGKKQGNLELKKVPIDKEKTAWSAYANRFRQDCKK